jgi:tRNA(Ile)-lysidine synthase TilS/MesJ
MADNEKDIKVEIDDTPEHDEAATSPLERFFYHQRRALEETGKALEALLPPGFREHASEAGKEFAQGFRILVDATIDELKKISEKDEEEEQADSKQKVEVEAEVEIEIEEEKPEEEKRPTTGKTKVKVKVE